MISTFTPYSITDTNYEMMRLSKHDKYLFNQQRLIKGLYNNLEDHKKHLILNKLYSGDCLGLLLMCLRGIL